MATQRYKTAHFDWTDSGAQTHNLAVPLQEIRPAYRFGGRFERESLSLVNREVWWASVVYEVVAVIRYDDTPQELIDLLIAGAKNITVTYDDSDGNTYACKMVGLANQLDVPFDENQKALDEHRIEIRLRKTDGSAFTSSIF